MSYVYLSSICYFIYFWDSLKVILFLEAKKQTNKQNIEL